MLFNNPLQMSAFKRAALLTKAGAKVFNVSNKTTLFVSFFTTKFLLSEFLRVKSCFFMLFNRFPEFSFFTTHIYMYRIQYGGI